MKAVRTSTVGDTTQASRHERPLTSRAGPLPRSGPERSFSGVLAIAVRQRSFGLSCLCTGACMSTRTRARPRGRARGIDSMVARMVRTASVSCSSSSRYRAFDPGAHQGPHGLHSNTQAFVVVRRGARCARASGIVSPGARRRAFLRVSRAALVRCAKRLGTRMRPPFNGANPQVSSRSPRSSKASREGDTVCNTGSRQVRRGQRRKRT